MLRFKSYAKMNMCRGRIVSDNARFPFYDSDGNETKEYYFAPLQCSNKAISDELCGNCLDKQEKTKNMKYKNHILKSNDGKRLWQPRILHGKMGTPIPPWSEIEHGEIYNARLKNGYRIQIEMPPKKKEEKKPTEEVKPKTVRKKKTTQPTNVVEELKPKMYVDTSQIDEAMDIVKIEVRPIKINGTQYYYDNNKDKLYTTELTYVGRYDRKKEVICTEYPDSDAEPEF